MSDEMKEDEPFLKIFVDLARKNLNIEIETVSNLNRLKKTYEKLNTKDSLEKSRVLESIIADVESEVLRLMKLITEYENRNK